MITKKNLVKTMFINILTAGIFATAFTACSDELKEVSDASTSNSFELMNLDQCGYSVPVKVDADGDWTVDIKFKDEKNSFCYALPDHGHGPATIKLCMLDNWTDYRNEAKMIIRDMEGNEIQSFPISQKCNLDNPDYSRTRGEGGGEENEAPENKDTKGNRNNGVGYGYNITKAPGKSAISRNPILKIEAVNAASDEGCGVTYSGTSAVIRVEQYGATSINELSRKMEVHSEIKGSRGGFKAEANATFSKSQTEKTTNMFGLGLVDVKVRESYVEGIDRSNVRKFMTQTALDAVDGNNDFYPSTPEGFKELIKNYGSHLILKADLGGRLRYGTTCDKQYCKNENEIKAMASCSYKNKIIEGSCNVTADQKKTFESNKKYITTTISAIGGSTKSTAALYGEGNDTDANVQAWIQSLDEKNNLAVVGFGQEDALELMPLYDLIDRKNNPERYKALKEYMETGMMENEAYEGTGNYSNGDIMKIDIPSADELMSKYGQVSESSYKTLVYEVWNQKKDEMVAMLCTEYLPEISKTDKVQTIYLVENGKPNFKIGRFLGDADNQACSFEMQENGTVKIIEKANSKGRENTLYLRGSKFFTAAQSTFSLNNADITDCTIKGKFMVAQRCKDDVSCTLGLTHVNFNYLFSDTEKYKIDESWVGKLKYDDNYHYPLVKIGNHIWTRENFSGNIPHGKNWKHRNGVKVVNGMVYYTLESINNLKTPNGWHVAKMTDFENLKSAVTVKRSSKSISEMMVRGGISGFQMRWFGWYTFKAINYHYMIEDDFEQYYYNYESQCWGKHHMEYYTKEGGHATFTDDNIKISKEKEENDWGMQIRLVMD